MTKIFRCLIVCAFIGVSAAAQTPFTLTPVELELADVNYGRMVHADVDGDGDLDILGTGNTETQIPFVSRSYVALAGDIVPISLFDQNLTQEFDVINISGAELWSSDARWTDYNLDGVMDFFVIGTGHSAGSFESGSFQGATRLYRGLANGGYQLTGTSIPGVYGGSIALGDYDNDGDEDVFVSGLQNPIEPVAAIYRNDDGTFNRINQPFTTLVLGEAKWVDIEGDGDLDLIHSGVSSRNTIHTYVYENGGSGTFTRHDNLLPALAFCNTAWGDFDSDGNLDVAISGARMDPYEFLLPESHIYRNAGGLSLSRYNSFSIPDLLYGSKAWADYDNDGDLDLMITGATDIGAGRFASVYRNEDGSFIRRIWLPGVSAGSAAWGDIDGNTTVDLLVTGSNQSFQPFSRIYRNETYQPNLPPDPPGNLQATTGTAGDVQLSWSAPDDNATDSRALTYSIRIGTSPNATDVMTAYADGPTGRRRVTGPGNVWHATSRKMFLPRGTYYWSVQAVDQSYMGSAFAVEQSFVISTAPGDVETASDNESPLEYGMESGYPNPFRESSQIPYTMRETGPVSVEVFNLLGQRISTLVSEDKAAGEHTVVWSGTNDQGSSLAAGVYFVRMKAGGHESMQRLVLVR